MTASKDELLPLGPWPKGVNNRADETTLAADELRAAVNADITTRGNPRSRGGYAKVFSGVDMHSWWARRTFPYGLVVDGNALKAINTDWIATQIRAGLKPSQPISYSFVNGEVYWSNGFDNGKPVAVEDQRDRTRILHRAMAEALFHLRSFKSAKIAT